MKNLTQNRNGKAKRIIFSDFYEVTDAFLTSLSNRLTILDPADPYDNIASRPGNQVDEIVEKAKSTLNQWDEDGFNHIFQHYFSRQIN